MQWECGLRDFAAGRQDDPAAIAATQPPPQLSTPVPHRKRRKPSDAGHDSVVPPTVAMDASGGQEFGTAVHEVFEQIEWWTPGQPLAGDKDAVALVRKCLQAAEIQAFFTPEIEQDEALCELPVEFMEKDTWWSGIVDRLVLRRDASGALHKAVLIDFKTDRVETAAALRNRYLEQLSIYRRAISAALKLRDDQVEVVLLSTHLESVLQL